MVQQMVDAKFNQYGLANNGTGVATCDKQQPVSSKKVALRELQNEPRNIILKPPGNAPLSKNISPILNASKLTGSKRPRPECPASPTCQQSPCLSGTNGHLVYACRKADLESDRLNVSDVDYADSPQSRKSGYEKQESHRQQNQMQDADISCFLAHAPLPVASLTTSPGMPSVPHSFGKLGNRSPVADLNYPMVNPWFHVPVNSQRARSQYWEERLVRLKMLLRSCEQSNYEDYIQTLRSLSSAECSRHAVDLEKRSVRLILEEAKEMTRMKALNVLGKSDLKSSFSPSAQSSFQSLASEK